MSRKLNLRRWTAALTVLFVTAAFCGCKPKDAQPTISPEDIVVVAPKDADAADTPLTAVLVGGEAFDAFVKSAPVVLVDFTATWCGPCQKLAPQIEKMAKSYQKDGVKFAKVDVDANQSLCNKLGVGSIPDIRVFVNGAQFAQTIGAIPVDIMTHLENALKAAQSPEAAAPAAETPAADAIFDLATAEQPVETPTNAATEAPVEQPAPADAPADDPTEAAAEQPAP